MKKQTTGGAPATNNPTMPFGKRNYLFILIGLVAIILGFILLSGGASQGPDDFNYEMFNFRRLYVAPVLLLVGFAFEIYAILCRPGKCTCAPNADKQ